MSKQNQTICKMCQKVLAYDKASIRHCEVWCDNGKEETLADDKREE